MLCLRQQICCNVSGGSGLICQYQDLAGARNGINADIAINSFFGKSYENVTGTGDLVDLRYRLGSESHGCDSLGTADLIDGIHTCNISGYQSSGIDLTVFSGRGGHNDLIHTGYLSGDHIHQYAGRVSGFTAGDIDTGSFDGGDLHA